MKYTRDSGGTHRTLKQYLGREKIKKVINKIRSYTTIAAVESILSNASLTSVDVHFVKIKYSKES